MNFEGKKLIRLELSQTLKPFDCDDSDLNSFFFDDCINYQKKLLAVTYIIEGDDSTVAFFSIFNDKISYKDVAKNPDASLWAKIKNTMPTGKQLGSYPAMKIGRLAVDKNHKGQQIGTIIIDYLKNLFITNNRTGCKFITVDAYSDSLGFYEKNGFVYLTEKDKERDTRAMYYDLSLLSQSN
jgi:predicted GNAT family N-acyltransferase